MPTISAYVSDDFAEAVTKAACSSPEKRVAPWVAEACRQRLASEGRMPGTPEANARAQFDEALRRHGPAQVVAKIGELEDANLSAPQT